MPSLQVTIRAATAGDRSMLFLLGEECLHPLAVRAGHPERFDEAQLLALLEEAEVCVAETEAGEIAGYVAFDDVAPAVALRCFCVNPAYEAQAVANRLLDWVEGLALDRGRTRLSAVVPVGDEASLHLYRRHDFTVRQGGDEADLLALEKLLPGR